MYARSLSDWLREDSERKTKWQSMFPVFWYLFHFHVLSRQIYSNILPYCLTLTEGRA